MSYPDAEEIIRPQDMVIARSGGGRGVLKLGKVESAAAQPRMTFDGLDPYPTLVEKAAALGFSLACNHGFVDGNKRIAHAAMEFFLLKNGHEVDAPVDEQENVFPRLAAHAMTRTEFTDWLKSRVVPRPGK